MSPPEESHLAKIWRTVVATYRIFSEIDVEQRAASFAYYALFSMIPLVTLLITTGSLFLNASDIVRAIQHVVPLEGDNLAVFQGMVGKLEQIRGGVSLVSVVILMWTGLRFFQALVHGVNRAWHTVELPWWQLPLKNLAMIAVIASGLLVGILIPAVMQAIRNSILALDSFLREHFPAYSDLNIDGIFVALDWMRLVFGGATLFYAISMLYMFAPRRRVSFRKIWFAALVVTVVLQVCQVAFVHYVPRFVNYNAVYGTFGGIMLLLYWVYISGMVILGGSCLCAAQAEVYGNSAERSEAEQPE